MIINDPVFGELAYFLVWSRDTTIHFCGKEAKITLTVKGEEDGKFDEEQYMAYQSLMQNWEHLQQTVLQAIFDYYKQSGMSLDMILNSMKIIPSLKHKSNYWKESFYMKLWCHMEIYLMAVTSDYSSVAHGTKKTVWDFVY